MSASQREAVIGKGKELLDRFEDILVETIQSEMTDFQILQFYQMLRLRLNQAVEAVSKNMEVSGL